MGLPNRIRKKTNLQLNTFMTEWTNQSAQPSQGPLFQAAMGGTPIFYNGGTVAAVTGQTQIQFTAAHGLSAGQAVTFSNEMRFVTAIENSTTVFLNAPFTTTPAGGVDVRDDGDVWLGRESAQREYFRLLGSVDGGAEDRGRRGGGHDDGEG